MGVGGDVHLERKGSEGGSEGTPREDGVGGRVHGSAWRGGCMGIGLHPPGEEGQGVGLYPLGEEGAMGLEYTLHGVGLYSPGEEGATGLEYTLLERMV